MEYHGIKEYLEIVGTLMLCTYCIFWFIDYLDNKSY